ncbi:MAG: hypothetical protein AABZ47_05720 [Planctomycetota bacterium]
MPTCKVETFAPIVAMIAVLWNQTNCVGCCRLLKPELLATA